MLAQPVATLTRSYLLVFLVSLVLPLLHAARGALIAPPLRSPL